MKLVSVVAVVVAGVGLAAATARGDVNSNGSGCAERRISLEDYRDRMRGAWIGQIVGVSWGQPTEFRWNDAIIPKADVPEWSSDFPLKYAYGNDDLYVEMTFLRTLERYGLDVSPRQAGIDFANSGYELWCANREGRLNLRTGVAPPDCSHPSLNKCPNDIDYQIEADYAGIVSPGCPDEVIRLGGLFGRLMNFGDGVWAGEFVGALYAEAFFTKDVDRLLDAGLRAIPAESDYAQMVRNVRAWHQASPDNWTNVWERIKSTYSKTAGAKLRDSNGGIDVRLNGACVVLGLLAGKGDLDASMEIAMRCGWDSDCNPSTVGGVLMCAAGAKALPAKYVEKLDYARKFSFTDYSLDALFAVCEKLARQIVVRQGGRIERDAAGREWFVVPARQPRPEPFVPSWAAGKPVGSRFTDEEMARQKFAHQLPNPADLVDPDPTVRVQKTLDALFAGWKTSANGESEEFSPGYRVSVSVLKNRQLMGCLLTNPPQKGGEVTLSRMVTVPPGDPKLSFVVANLPKGGEFGLRVRVDGATVLSTTVSYPWADEVANGYARTFEVSLQPWVGQTVRLELVDASLGGERNEACWHDIRLTSGSGTFDDGIAAAVPLSVDFGRVVGPMKPLHGVNNAPMRVAEGSRQDEFAAAGIPFVRTHDTAGMWGGAHYVDIPNVFPDFDADENDPASYDFAFTDAYLKPLVEAGCQPFYRLGVTIENYWKVKAYHIDPPKDFAKWARICEHVVRHYNEGWANGFRWNLVYWEIWNEPENPPMWQGTREQFFELYRVTANHLKTCFPQIRVGGYAGCGFYSLDDAAMKNDAFYAGFLTWFEDFVKYVQDPKTKAPLDFYSWHLYVGGDWTIDRIGIHADYVRRTLDAAGLAKTESIFDEWNVFEGRAHRGFDAIKEPPAAARVMAAFALMQAGTIDKAMYYDALPTRSYCGLFYFPSIRTTPTYEAFRAFDHLYRLGESVGVTSAGKGVYACAAKGTNGKALVVANVGAEAVAPDLKMDGADGQTFRVYRLDERHRVLMEDGTWRAGERLVVPKDGFVLLTTVGLTSVKESLVRPAVPLNGIESNGKKSK